MYKHLEVEGFLQKMSLKKSVFREPRGSGDSDKVLQDYSRTIRSIFIRVVPDTDLARYQPNNFAGYQISDKKVNIVFKKKKRENKYSFQQNLPTFLVGISASRA